MIQGVFAFNVYVSIVLFTKSIIAASTQCHWTGTHPTSKVSKSFYPAFLEAGLSVVASCVVFSGRLPVPRSQLPTPMWEDDGVKKCPPSSTFSTNADLMSPYSISLPLPASVLYICGRGSLTHRSIEFSVRDP